MSKQDSIYSRRALLFSIGACGLGLVGCDSGPTKNSRDNWKTYTSPTYGYSFAWDPAVWDLWDEVVAARGARVESHLGSSLPDLLDSVTFFRWDGGVLTVRGFLGLPPHPGDPQLGIRFEVELLESSRIYRNVVAAVDESGNVLAGMTNTGGFYAIYTYELSSEAGTPTAKWSAWASYIKCQTLIPGRAILIVEYSGRQETFNEGVVDAVALSDTIRLASESEPTSVPILNPRATYVP